MFKGLSKEFKQLIIDELCKKYDSINMKLQDDLAKYGMMIGNWKI